MSKAITPGRLLKWAVALFVIWVVVVFAISLGTNTSETRQNVLDVIDWVAIAAIAVLLLMAGVSKAVQIGVRTGRD